MLFLTGSSSHPRRLRRLVAIQLATSKNSTLASQGCYFWCTRWRIAETPQAETSRQSVVAYEVSSSREPWVLPNPAGTKMPPQKGGVWCTRWGSNPDSTASEAVMLSNYTTSTFALFRLYYSSFFLFLQSFFLRNIIFILNYFIELYIFPSVKEIATDRSIFLLFSI